MGRLTRGFRGIRGRGGGRGCTEVSAEMSMETGLKGGFRHARECRKKRDVLIMSPAGKVDGNPSLSSVLNTTALWSSPPSPSSVKRSRHDHDTDHPENDDENPTCQTISCALIQL